MVRVEGLSVSASDAALTFDVPDGQCVGLLGRDASAALDLAETIAGMRTPSAGRVLVGGADILRDAVARAQIIICLPRAAHRATSIEEHVSTVAAARGAVRVPVADAIARLGVDPRARLTTAAARSAAALVASLVPDAGVIVLHDPFSGLHEDVRRRATDWIRALSGSRTSIVMIGLNERDVRAVSHSVISAGAGR